MHNLLGRCELKNTAVMHFKEPGYTRTGKNTEKIASKNCEFLQKLADDQTI